VFFDSVQSSRVLGLVRQFNCSGVSTQAETCNYHRGPQESVGMFRLCYKSLIFFSFGQGSEKMFRLEKRDNIMCSCVLRDNIKQARDMKCCARCK